MIPSRLALVSKDSALGIDGLVQMNYFLLGCKQPIFTMNVSFGEGTVPQPASFKWLEWPFGLFFQWPFQRSNGHFRKKLEDMLKESGQNQWNATVISPWLKAELYYPPVNKHSNGKSPSWIGNTSSNGGFSIAMLDYRRVVIFVDSWWFCMFAKHVFHKFLVAWAWSQK